MTNTLLDNQLQAVEQQLDVLRADLLNANPQAVEQASGVLQRLAVDLLQMTDEISRSDLNNSHLIQRVRAIAQTMQPVREGLLRHGAYVERALEVVMPASQQATYAGGARYGAAARQSGAFKALSA